MGAFYTQHQKKLEQIQDQFGRSLRTLNALSSESLQGWRSYLVVRDLRQALNAGRLESNYLLITILRACEDAMILALSKIATGGGEVNAKYLLDRLEESINTLDKFVSKYGRDTIANALPKPASGGTFVDQLLSIDSNKVRTSIAQDRHQLASVELVAKTMVTRRDKLIAHMDKKLLSDPLAVAERPFSNTDVQQAFNQIFTIVRKYYVYLHPHLDPAGFLSDIDGGVPDDLERMIKLAEEYNRISS